MGEAKVYVGVKADFREDGVMLPRRITWEDGTEYNIDYIKDIRQAAAMRAGGQGDRYTVMIDGKQSYLFLRAQHKPDRQRNWPLVRRAPRRKWVTDMCCRYYMGDYDPEETMEAYYAEAQRRADTLGLPVVSSGEVRPTNIAPVIAPNAK